MRQSIRVLGWTITIASLLTFAFLGLSIYSLFQLVMEQGIAAGESSVNISNGDYVISLPFLVNNTSYFDITKLEITTIIKDPEGGVISQSTTSSGIIPSGSSTNISHYISIDLNKMIEKNLTDANILMDTIMDLRYANIIGFSVTMANVSIPWDASISPRETFSVSTNRDGAPFSFGNKTNIGAQLLLHDQFRVFEVNSCPR
ncbi:MAG: hypothetical protein OEZ48_08385 [Candidatus Bathyarchaeota archaeon]|nr:hypothetical protein [Candidatus Bathyarchaeota archaeon]MDH5687863.1 hypothetical protein [Candidatus Bathyarchaeota archaeon]